MASSFFSSIFLIFVLYISRRTTFSLLPTGVKLPMIHRLSLPEYSNKTFQHLAETNLELIKMKFAALDEGDFNFETPLIQFSSTGSMYLLNVTIGTPPVPQYLEVDTGSSLTWVRGSSDPPRQYFYNPQASETYMYVSCGDPICLSADTFMCLLGKVNRCGYTIMYADRTKSSGVLGHDRFGFVNYADPTNRYVVENVFFGALGNVKNGSMSMGDPHYYGVFGLGPRSMSIVNLIPKPKVFSFCIANLSSADEFQSYIHFGEMQGDYYSDLLNTPILQGFKQYIVEIQQICLDDACLEIDPSVFKHIPGVNKSGVSVDTGSLYSYLPDIAYDKLQEAVVEMMKSKNKTYLPEPYKRNRLCYSGNMHDAENYESYYPRIIITFVSGGAKMTIARTEYFRQVDDNQYCLQFLKSSRQLGDIYKNYTIIGLQIQQYHLYEFDLDNWTMSIMDETVCNEPR